MKRSALLLAIAAVLVSAAGLQAFDETHHGKAARRRAELRPWHGYNYHVMYGQPVALVIPPTAEYTADYAWGVPSVQTSRNDHQFQRPYPGPFQGGYGFTAPARFPNHTRAIGVYQVRGPW